MIEEDVLEEIEKAGVEHVLHLPCERIKRLLRLAEERFHVIHLSREEEGVGILSGLYLGGERGLMVIQSSGLGNMVNAICSLTLTYELPLPLLISWRGKFGEKIPAQVPLGERIEDLLHLLGIEHGIFDGSNPEIIRDMIEKSYEEERPKAVLLKPDIWTPEKNSEFKRKYIDGMDLRTERMYPEFTRYEMLEEIKGEFEGKAIICNLGIPSKELYDIRDSDLNFYMLGSMGLVTSIASGVAMATDLEVISIDGDGSILMNPSTLAIPVSENLVNLTVLAMDNFSYGSTGNQPTHTFRGVDLQVLAISMGFRHTFRTATPEGVIRAMKEKGPKFIHVVLNPGNMDVDIIPLSPVEIKTRFMKALRGKT